MFKVKFSKLGAIDYGEIDVKPLTVLCGENNTGKTYATYAYYGLLKELRKLRVSVPTVEQLKQAESGELEIDLIEASKDIENKFKSLVSEYSGNIFTVFSAKQDAFVDASVKVEFDKKKFEDDLFQTEARFPEEMGNDVVFIKDKNSFVLKIKYSMVPEEGMFLDNVRILLSFLLRDILIKHLVDYTFILPAERSGLNLFFKELNVARNELVHGLAADLLNDEMRDMRSRLRQSISPYPVPISDYLSFLNRLDIFDEEESTFKDLAQEIQESILRGTYEVKDQQIFYRNEEGASLHIHVSSSTVKSLFGLVFYLTYMAKPGQHLIIDEPELNLHPDNQRKLARILAKISNRGINVFISTHSDYIVKEFNNLLMLSKMTQNREALMARYGYQESELLNENNIAPYLFRGNRIEEVEIDPIEGIIAETFDQVINRHNEVSDEIYYSLLDERGSQGDSDAD